MNFLKTVFKLKKFQNFDQIYTEDLESVLRQSDFIVNSLPQTPHTVNLLSSGILEVAAANSPVFINVGRGSVIGECKQTSRNKNQPKKTSRNKNQPN